MAQSSTQRTMPMVILGGSDREPGTLPPSGQDKHPITGSKGTDIRFGNQRLIEILIERYQDMGCFDPIYVAGPESAYRGVIDSERLIATDAEFGQNIRKSIETATARHHCEQLAMSTCDILPEPAELEAVLGHYFQHAPLDFWFPLIRAPQDPSQLGESSWKPRYKLALGDDEPTAVLPSHITIFDPAAMRLRFLYRLLNAGYESRNRPIRQRRSFLLRQIVFGLLWHDLLHVLGLRLPTLTMDVLLHGLTATPKLLRNELTEEDLDTGIRYVFVKRRHRLAHPGRHTRLPVLDGLSLARDIDTVEEATAIGATASANQLRT